VPPVVSVVIATYNWSSVLRYAIQSVLWQTFQDFELLVIGDGCTDDSEQVVASFNDPRVRWFNLPENSGSQSAPNNKGIELASGTYIAHLGHDDLWHPTHLQVLVAALKESGGDFAYTLCDVVHPDPKVGRMVTGLTATGQFEPYAVVPPSSWTYKRQIGMDVGGWRDGNTVRLPVDIDFLMQLWEHNVEFVPVHDLTVFKFPSAWRKNSYIDKPSHQQVEMLRRLESEPEMRYRELLSFIREPNRVAYSYDFKVRLNAQTVPGYLMMYNRVMRGLAREDELQAFSREEHYNVAVLYNINLKNDISPIDAREWLHQRHELPQDGLLIGFGWYDFEQNEFGARFRWVNNDAELVLTRPSGTRRKIKIELASGPGIDYKPFVLQVLDKDNQQIASLDVQHQQVFSIEIPASTLSTREDCVVLRLHTEAQGHPLETDPRILTFAVFSVNWISQEEQERSAVLAATLTECLNERDDLQRQLESLHKQMSELTEIARQLDSFRTTSLRYWMHRVHTSPKLKRWLRRG
jgi:glycosyltransferase involved in cell wall biosynthesis